MTGPIPRIAGELFTPHRAGGRRAPSSRVAAPAR